MYEEKKAEILQRIAQAKKMVDLVGQSLVKQVKEREAKIIKDHEDA